MPEVRSRDNMEYGPSSLAARETDDIYAGFWQRVGAISIDGGILAVITWFVQRALGTDSLAGSMGANLASILVAAAYFAGQEGGQSGATLGKRAFGLRVTDGEFRPVSFGQALLRYGGRILTSLTLCLGYLGAVFSERRRTLHDVVAGTVVIRDGERLPSSTLMPLVIVALATGLMSLRGWTSALWSQECLSIPPRAAEAAARARLPSDLPVPADLRLASLEREGETVRIQGTWRTGVKETFDYWDFGLPFELTRGRASIGDQDASVEFSGGRIEHAQVRIKRCGERTDVRITAVYRE